MNSSTDKIESLKRAEYFDFSQIAEYVKKYTPKQFMEFFETDKDSIIDENLEIIIIDDGYYSERICMGKNIPSFTYDWVDKDKHSNVTWEILENFIYPIHYDVEYEEMMNGYNDNLWDMRFVEDYNNLTTFAISNRTDFNEKFGWYPHLETLKGFIPLNFIGEFIVDNRKAYLFLDCCYNSAFFKNNSSEDIVSKHGSLNFDDIYCVVFEDDLKLSDLFIKRELNDFDRNLISLSKANIVDTIEDKRFVPIDPVFNFAPNVQDYYGPDIEKLISGEWRFLYQLPIPWYGANKVEETNYYTIDKGDSASVVIFVNEHNEFRIEYAQT